MTENFRHVFFHPTSIQSSPQLDHVSITLLSLAEFLILIAVQWCTPMLAVIQRLTNRVTYSFQLIVYLEEIIII